MNSTALIPHAGTSPRFTAYPSIGTVPEREFPIPRDLHEEVRALLQETAA